MTVHLALASAAATTLKTLKRENLVTRATVTTKSRSTTTASMSKQLCHHQPQNLWRHLLWLKKEPHSLLRQIDPVKPT